MRLDVLAQLLGLPPAALDKGLITLHARDLAEARQYLIQEPAQPDALAPTLDPDQIHAVVPVAGTHQRQAMLAEAQTVQDGAHAMLVETCRFVGLTGQVVIGVVLATDQAALQEAGRLLQHADIPGGRR